MSQIPRVSRYLFCYYMGNWVPRAEITGRQGTEGGRDYLVQQRRKWHARGRSKR